MGRVAGMVFEGNGACDAPQFKFSGIFFPQNEGIKLE